MPHLSFGKEDFEAFKANDREGPIHMLNLVKLLPKAKYEDGTEVDGAEAYATYGRETAPIFQRVGGKIVWRGKVEQMLIGPSDDEQWDVCFIAEYPSPAAFIAMISDPEYRRAMVHRQVSVADSRLIRMAPTETRETFAD
ncbi:DUF1330 domain-containing protein [Shimia thalassica]|uniref:DUF1330 domain-containing protein n=1 Tax=Shimia thalassica TaxID=1715693 RepID=UPI0027334D3D|nr:DUF1330 domain-containing protein [Shimia thalassica]MDP2494031.1 DUF1330 domain-containing protein [Shimia thalassica]